MTYYVFYRESSTKPQQSGNGYLLSLTLEFSQQLCENLRFTPLEAGKSELPRTPF